MIYCTLFIAVQCTIIVFFMHANDMLCTCVQENFFKGQAITVQFEKHVTVSICDDATMASKGCIVNYHFQ